MVGQQEWARRGEAATAAATAVSGALPVGVITAYWGTAAPAGWLICNGSSFSAATYPALAAFLGGTTLPNLKGRMLVGIDAAQTEFDTLGETGGSKTASITSANLPTHTHSIDHDHGAKTSAGGSSHDHGLTNHNHGGGTGVHSHTFNGGVWGTSNTAHTHYIGGSAGEVSAAPQGAGRASSAADISTVGVANTTQGSADTAHTHSVDLDNFAGSSGNGGFAGTAMAALPPYIAINYLIKAA